MGDCSKLLIELIGVIVGKLEFLSDIQRSAFVCLSWRSAAMEISAHLFHPMLITSYEEDAEACNLYSPLDKKAFKLHLPELHNKWCCGTSNGWLVTIDDDLAVRLLHPFSRAQVSLPTLPPLSPRSVRVRGDMIAGHPDSGRWKSKFAEKLIVSGNPLNPDCVFVKIGGVRNEVALCRATDDTWTSLEGPWECVDAIFYEGRLHLVAYWPAAVWDVMWVWDTCSNTAEGRVETPVHTLPQGINPRQYLVESSGDLLLVTRHLNIGIDDQYTNLEADEDLFLETVGFQVFKLIHEGDVYKAKDPWERITCLGGQALFLGRNQSFSLPAERYSGYKANRIYFTDDSELGLIPHDTGEFNMEDGSVTFYDGLDDHVVHWPPVWLKQH